MYPLVCPYGLGKVFTFSFFIDAFLSKQDSNSPATYLRLPSIVDMTSVSKMSCISTMYDEF